MSIDLYIHTSTATPLTRDGLIASLREKGVAAEIYADFYTGQIAQERLSGSFTVVGWMPDDLEPLQVSEAMKPSNEELREHLFSEERLAYCQVYSYSSQEFLSNYDEGYFDGYRESADAELLSAAESAASVYELNTSAGRTPFSATFQCAVCEAIGVLLSGVIEDPQVGVLMPPSRAKEAFGL